MGTWISLGPWFGALATFLAVLVALRLHIKIFPPLLTLKLLSTDGEATTVTITTQNDGEVVSSRSEQARYYHLRLTNERSWIVATDVGVLLVGIETEDASGNYVEVWSGSLPVVATHYGVHPTRTLGAAPQDFDLCSVVRNKWLQLHTLIVPNNFPYRYRVGKEVRLRLTFQARSLEALSRLFVFELAWDCQWEDDTIKMRRHMVVKQL